MSEEKRKYKTTFKPLRCWAERKSMGINDRDEITKVDVWNKI